MTTEEFKRHTAGIQAGRLAELLLCSRFSVDRYRTGAPIPAKICRRVTALDRVLQSFRKTNFVKGDEGMDAVFARESETGLAGMEGILTYAAAGCEAEFTPETLLKAVQDWQDTEGRISEDDWLNDDSGRIHKVTLDDCERYLEGCK